MTPSSQARALRHRDKAHRNRRQRFLRRSHRLFHQRISSLVSVGQSDGRAQLVLRDVLEARQVFAGMGRVAGLLVGARNAEFGRSMQRIQFERMLEGVNRLRILLELRRRGAQKIPAVGVVRIDLGDVAKSIHRSLRIIGILVQQAQVEPGVGIVGSVLACSLQQSFGGLDAGQVQQRDALIQRMRSAAWDRARAAS